MTPADFFAFRYEAAHLEEIALRLADRARRLSKPEALDAVRELEIRLVESAALMRSIGTLQSPEMAFALSLDIAKQKNVVAFPVNNNAG